MWLLLDKLVVLANPFAHRFNGASNGSRAACSSGLSPSTFSGFMLRTLQPRS